MCFSVDGPVTLPVSFSFDTTLEEVRGVGMRGFLVVVAFKL